MGDCIVWHILYDVDGPGEYETGQVTRRFTRKADADACAAGRECWGRPASPDPLPCSAKLIARWRREGKIST